MDKEKKYPCGCEVSVSRQRVMVSPCEINHCPVLSVLANLRFYSEHRTRGKPHLMDKKYMLSRIGL